MICQCGNQPGKGDIFCRKCGEELPHVEYFLCECGADVMFEDSFCHACGAEFDGVEDLEEMQQAAAKEFESATHVCNSCGQDI